MGIYATHGHLDHIGAVSKIQKDRNLPFYIHEKDTFLVETLPQACGMFGLPRVEIPTIKDNLDKDSLISTGDYEIQVIETPGHTPGGICFVLENHIFVGDTLFRNSIGRTDLPGGNHQQLIDSIKDVLFSLDDQFIVHSGHGPDTTIGYEKMNNPFLQ